MRDDTVLLRTTENTWKAAIHVTRAEIWRHTFLFWTFPDPSRCFCTEVEVSNVGKAAMWWEREKSRIVGSTRLVPIPVLLASLPCRGGRCEVKSAVVIIGGLDLAFTRSPSPLKRLGSSTTELARLIPPPRHRSDPAIRASTAAPSKRSRRVRESIS
jgi:hypothetical protein